MTLRPSRPPHPSQLLSSLSSPPPSSPSLKIRVCQGSGCLGKCRGVFNPFTLFEELKQITDGKDNDNDNTNNNRDTEESRDGGMTITMPDAYTPTSTTCTNIEIEKSFCMNQCKRGPTIRIINADNGNVLIFNEDTIMNETEIYRKSFQGVNNEKRVNYLWKIVNGVGAGTIRGIEKGSVDKLNDIMPRPPNK
mmetsp:Transcript_41497/g.47897  ORF Transcript_41497/g.47897 Transcript_41497/m.47897 type:complete len:193 (-) Transcript_41497:358-936(-)